MAAALRHQSTGYKHIKAMPSCGLGTAVYVNMLIACAILLPLIWMNEPERVRFEGKTSGVLSGEAPAATIAVA